MSPIIPVEIDAAVTVASDVPRERPCTEYLVLSTDRNSSKGRLANFKFEIANLKFAMLRNDP
jgi:hypothetical protein